MIHKNGIVLVGLIAKDKEEYERAKDCEHRAMSTAYQKNDLIDGSQFCRFYPYIQPLAGGLKVEGFRVLNLKSKSVLNISYMKYIALFGTKYTKPSLGGCVFEYGINEETTLPLYEIIGGMPSITTIGTLRLILKTSNKYNDDVIAYVNNNGCCFKYKDFELSSNGGNYGGINFSFEIEPSTGYGDNILNNSINSEGNGITKIGKESVRFDLSNCRGEVAVDDGVNTVYLHYKPNNRDFLEITSIYIPPSVDSVRYSGVLEKDDSSSRNELREKLRIDVDYDVKHSVLKDLYRYLGNTGGYGVLGLHDNFSVSEYISEFGKVGLKLSFIKDGKRINN